MADSLPASGNFITVTLDLSKQVPRTYGPVYNEDGDRDERPTTLQDQIVAAAADQLIGVGKRDLRKMVAKQVQEAVAEYVAAELPGIFRDVLNASVEVPPANEWDQPTKLPSLREQIMERATKELRNTRDRYGNGRALLEELVNDGVRKALAEELQGAVNQAKATVVAALREHAAELLATESARKAGITF